MATTREIALFDTVELLENVDAAPAGAQGGVLEFHDDGDVAVVEIMKPELERLDRIVSAPLSTLRLVS
jgi:hypothetical protein